MNGRVRWNFLLLGPTFRAKLLVSGSLLLTVCHFCCRKAHPNAASLGRCLPLVRQWRIIRQGIQGGNTSWLRGVGGGPCLFLTVRPMRILYIPWCFRVDFYRYVRTGGSLSFQKTLSFLNATSSFRFVTSVYQAITSCWKKYQEANKLKIWIT